MGLGYLAGWEPRAAMRPHLQTRWTRIARTLFYAMGGSTGWQAPTEGLSQAELRPENSCLAPGNHRSCELDERPAHL